MLTFIWPHRRQILALAAVATFAAAPALAQQPVRGGSMTMVLTPEPPMLTNGYNSASPVAGVAPKIFDGLVEYTSDFKLTPQIATSWEQAPDGLTVTFKLREGIKWHDGKPLTSEDVRFSFMDVIKKYHSRGVTTFANLTAVETPDPLTAVFKLSEPTPYFMRALAGVEAPIMPKHVYDVSDPLRNPANTRPIGSGPFKFKEWVRGSHLILERNPDYWDQPRPYLDQIVIRFIPDAAARAVALESGAVQYGTQYIVPLNDVERLSKLPNLNVTTSGYDYNTSVNYLDFNLRKPLWQDVRVRRAIFHAIDKDFLVKNIWFGFATPATGAITDRQADFHTDDVQLYPFDLKKAAELLDEAGHKPDANGQRLAITVDYVPSGETYRQTAEYLKQSLARIGVNLTVRSQDSPTYLRRIWNANDFDINIYSASNIADPVIGIQRFYWSKSIQKGVAYSNGAGYSSPEMDKILETAQVENDPDKRRELYHRMQKLAAEDATTSPLVYIKWFTIHDRRLKNLHSTGLGPLENFAKVWLEK